MVITGTLDGGPAADTRFGNEIILKRPKIDPVKKEAPFGPPSLLVSPPARLMNTGQERLSCVSHTQQHRASYRTAVRGSGVSHSYYHPSVATPGGGSDAVTASLLPCRCPCPRHQRDQEAPSASQPRQVLLPHNRVVPVEPTSADRWSVHTMPSVIHTPPLRVHCSCAVRSHGPAAKRRAAHPVLIASSPPHLVFQNPCAIMVRTA